MRFQWLIHFCVWLDKTAVSQFIQGAGWVVPTVQTVHILSISAVLASATMIALRLAGRLGTEQSPGRFAARFLPFIWWPLLALALTGVVMIVGEPGRELLNPVFQLKMVLVITAMVATWMIGSGLETSGDTGGTGAVAAAGGVASAQWLSLLALVLWVVIIMAGRWIAYI